MRPQFPAAGLEALPIVDITIDGRPARALLDTGCSRTVIATWISGVTARGKQEIVAVDGSRVTCAGTATVVLHVCGKVVRAGCVVVNRLISGIDAVLGMDVLTRMGGVMISGDGVRLIDDPEGGRAACGKERVGDALDGGRDICEARTGRLMIGGDGVRMTCVCVC